jgi:hypothetical protein
VVAEVPVETKETKVKLESLENQGGRQILVRKGDLECLEFQGLKVQKESQVSGDQMEKTDVQGTEEKMEK